MMTGTDRQFLFDLRKALLHLHKTLLDWERAAYERVHGRSSSSELLKAIVEDPQFGWLHPISELIVHIDQTVDTEAAGEWRRSRGDSRQGAHGDGGGRRRDASRAAISHGVAGTPRRRVRAQGCHQCVESTVRLKPD
jgi:hypothetical protein